MTTEEIKTNLGEILRQSQDVRTHPEWFMAVLEAYDRLQDACYPCTGSDKTWGGGYNPNTNMPSFTPYSVTCAKSVTREINTGKEL